MADNNNTPAYLRYANAGATRNKPLDQNLVDALGFLQDMGVQMEVFSGGQVTAAEAANGLGGRTGSTRHDHGGAADAFFYQGGCKLDWADPNDRPIFQEIVRRGREAGITGFGAGPGYMQPGSMHIGLGSAGVWGAGGKGDNAPDWLKEAFSGASGSSTGGPTIERAAALPNTPSERAGLAGGFENANTPHAPPQQPANPNWLTAATHPNTTFQTTPVSPSDEPAQGTLAAVLAATWKDPAHGWHKMRGGQGLYATARHFVVALGADRLVDTIDAETLEAYLKDRDKEERTAIIRAVYHLLRYAWRYGWLSSRPVRLAAQKDRGLPSSIAFRWTPQYTTAPDKRRHSQKRKEVRFVRLPADRGCRPLWRKVEA